MRIRNEERGTRIRNEERGSGTRNKDPEQGTRIRNEERDTLRPCPNGVITLGDAAGRRAPSSEHCR